MSRPQGTNNHKPKDICMVVGCTGPALYRNANSKQNGRLRGYCGRHKEYAICHHSESNVEWTASAIEHDESGGIDRSGST